MLSALRDHSRRHYSQRAAGEITPFFLTMCGSDPLCGRAAPLRIHTHNARIATSKDVADELWWMATKYQDQAARLGEAPELGDEPPLWKLAR